MHKAPLLSNVLRSLFLGLFLLGSSQLFSQGEVYMWVGAGTASQTIPGRDADWTNEDNWEIDGSPANSIPGPDDFVDIRFTENSNAATPADGLIIPTGTQVKDLDIRGTDNTAANGRFVAISGNVQSETLRVRTGTSNANTSSGFHILSGAVLTLTGGTAENPTLRSGGNTNYIRTSIVGDGTLRFTGTDVFVDYNASIAPGNIVFENSVSTISMVGTTDDRFYVETDGGFIDFPAHIEFLTSFQFEGERSNTVRAYTLDSEDNKVFGAALNAPSFFVDSSNRRTNIALPEATISHVNVNGTATSNGHTHFRMDGDLTLVGSFTAEVDDVFREFALRVSRINQHSHTFTSNGYDLTAVLPGVAIEFGASEDDGDQVTTVDLRGDDGRITVINAAGDLVFQRNSLLQADDGTLFRVEGDFLVLSDRSAFQSHLVDVELIGAGTLEAPQYFEINSEDLGETDPGTNNFAFKSLTIGTSEDATYVQLIDEVNYAAGPAQALYLGSLFVHEDSVLDLNFLNLYVDGELVTPGSGEYGPGLIVIPEPGLAVFALLATVGLWYRFRSTKKG